MTRRLAIGARELIDRGRAACYRRRIENGPAVREHGPGQHSDRRIAMPDQCITGAAGKLRRRPLFVQAAGLWPENLPAALRTFTTA